jgi:hypothetical protein
MTRENKIIREQLEDAISFQPVGWLPTCWGTDTDVSSVPDFVHERLTLAPG